MHDWDRIQRLETELAKAHARILDMEALLAADVHPTRTHEKLRAAVHRMTELMEQRESARALAIRLWDESAACPNQDHHTPWGLS